MTTGTKTPEQIVEILIKEGWSLDVKLINPGDRKTQSDWSVTINRQGKVGYTTKYHKGAAHRRWLSKDSHRFNIFCNQSRGLFKDYRILKGKRIPQIINKLSVYMAEALDHYTEPAPPTIDEVIYCLLLDAGGVRHGQAFTEWAANYGYDDDSIKAKSCFEACRDIWSALVRLNADFDELDALFEDY